MAGTFINRWFPVALKGLVFVIVCALLWASIDVRATGRLLASADVGWLVAALGLVQIQIVLSALRWRFTAMRLGKRLARRRVVAEYYLATLLNQTLPGGISGDAARIVRNRDAGGSAVVIERLAGQFVFLLVTLTGLAFWLPLTGRALPLEGLRSAGFVLLVILCVSLVVLLTYRFGPFGWRRKLVEFCSSVHRSWLVDGSFGPQASLSLGIVFTYLAVFGLCGLAIDHPLPWAGLITVVPLTLLTMLVPVSVGGWGVREAAAAFLWPLIGATAETGVATSVLYGLVSVAGSLPGLLVLLMPDRSKLSHTGTLGAGKRGREDE